MKKVFAILCHQITNPLIYTIEYFSSIEGNIILLHVDAKADIKDFLFLEKNNVLIIKERVAVNWGEFSQIKATLNLFEEAALHCPDFTFLLSGDDVPIKSDKNINKILSDNNLKNLIHYQDVRSNYVDPMDRVGYRYPKFFFKKENKLLRKIFNLFKFFFKNKELLINKCPKLYKGTSWIGVNHATLNYILNFVKTNTWYEKIFKQSFCADEIFFHTIIKENPKLENYSNKSLRSDALRYIDWETGPEYPRLLNETDFLKITNSNMIFARKFSKDVSFSFMKSFIQED